MIPPPFLPPSSATTYLYISPRPYPDAPFFLRRGWVVSYDPRPEPLAKALASGHISTHRAIVWDGYRLLTPAAILVLISAVKYIFFCDNSAQALDAIISP